MKMPLFHRLFLYLVCFIEWLFLDFRFTRLSAATVERDESPSNERSTTMKSITISIKCGGMLRTETRRFNERDYSEAEVYADVCRNATHLLEDCIEFNPNLNVHVQGLNTRSQKPA